MVVPNAAGWCSIVPDDAGWSAIVPYYAIWCIIVRDGAGWCDLVKHGIGKMAAQRLILSALTAKHNGSWLKYLHPLHETDLLILLSSMSSKKSPRDLISTSLLKECSGVFTKLVNLSFTEAFLHHDSSSSISRQCWKARSSSLTQLAADQHQTKQHQQEEGPFNRVGALEDH